MTHAEASGRGDNARCSRLHLAVAALAALVLAGCVSGARTRTVQLVDATGTSRPCGVPVSVELDLGQLGCRATARPGFRVIESLGSTQALEIQAQFMPGLDATRGTLCWLLPPGVSGGRIFTLKAIPQADLPSLHTEQDPSTGRWNISENGRLVLGYNYQTNEPGDLLALIHTNNLKYARPRGNYIHPLCGPEGEVLTKDWSIDHPHHRGIYWAWPEVDYRGERGDLHALQRVFARPTGKCVGLSGPVFAQIDAENLWLWEDREPIVRERAVIRLWRSEAGGRFVDLEFHFTALKEDVAIARRDTKLYGGLNVRLASVQGQRIEAHLDPASEILRPAWADLSGVFASGKRLIGLTVFQHPLNPGYPGDWVKYPELNWLQPAFPAAGSRHVLKKDQPLVLRYRLWIHAGSTPDSQSGDDLWLAFMSPPTELPLRHTRSIRPL